ncbi:MAG: PilT/PilU family type 4a pilus ATPase [Deltaproteobacteria bacterium]|nr:PilT/PilU family type 4a pilus ATPase [Deltaproteobacteria bacterium]
MEIEKILEAAVQQGVSDVMLKDGSPPMFRHCGELKRVEGAAPLSTQEVQAALARFLSSDDRRVRFISERHADLAFDEPNVGRFRVHAYRQRGKLGMVLRVIPTAIRRFDELQLPAVVERIANERRGLILVTGPTGSGKTTTLAAIIDYMNRNSSRHIITIEDPIEYLHDDLSSVISQREIGTDADDFASALRFALRQIPDVIMVGEMRDLEAIETAIVAAETGHLVLSTLHTIDAPETIK